MSRREATFEIESKSDANAVRLLTERMYDTLREELREVGGDDGADEALAQFEAIREAASRPSPGTLAVVYEPADEPFDDWSR